MNNSIFELVKSHCSIFNKNLQNVKLPIGTDKTVNGIFQLDYLQFYPDNDKLEMYGIPWNVWEVGIKDNPNRVPTERENVFIKTEVYWEHFAIDYELCVPWKSPVAIMNRYYFKVRKGSEYIWRWRVSIYGKALRLYYLWYIPWLKNYVIKYSWECSRADLCRDFPCEFPNGIIDLDITWTSYDTVYFGGKNSPIFFRKYNKTQDLRREKNCFARFYPDWYIKDCWRLECQLSWDYSRSMSPIEWLDIMQVNKNSKLLKTDTLQRNVYKTALYSVINTIDWVNISQNEKLDILINSKKVIENKIKKLSKDIY